MADEKDRKPKVEVERGKGDEATAAAEPAARAGGPEPGAASGAGTSGTGASGTASPKGLSAVSAWVGRTFPGNENAFWGGVAGLVAALVLIAIGPWYAFVVGVCVVVGVAVGQMADGNPRIVRALRRLFSRNQ